MKLSEFLKSKRTWTIIGLGTLQTLEMLFPGKVASLVSVIKSIFTGQV